MAAFFVTRELDPPRTTKHLDEAHRRNGFELARKIRAGGFCLHLYRKLDGKGGLSIETGANSSASLVGQLVYRGQSGEEGLRLYCADLARGQVDADRIIGQYALILADRQGFLLSTDPMSFYRVYVNESAGLAASSFWAMLELLPSITINARGVYQYAWNGATFGRSTFVKEISQLPADTSIVFSGEMRLAGPAAAAPVQNSTGEGAERSLASYVEEHAERLRQLFGDLASAFGERLRVSFSGGFDSRLILAGLKAVGLQPGLFVYGQNDDIDVRIAACVARCEGLALEIVDKSRLTVPPGEQIQQDADFVTFDAWKVDGIFDDGSDGLDRRRRHSQDRVPLNGSLGEIYRNFFYIPDRSLVLREVVESFFSGYAPAACTERFRVRDYVSGLANAFQAELGSPEYRLSRNQIERLYPLVRGRYWTGRDVNLNHRFGQMAFPFMQRQLIEGSSEIPLRFKDYGVLEARLIERLDPSVAQYPTSYGHRFSDPPPLRYRVKTWATLFRPPWARRYSYRFRFARPSLFPWYLQSRHLGRYLDCGMPYMRRYFHPDRVHDPDAFNRIATMEYIYQRYSAAE